MRGAALARRRLHPGDAAVDGAPAPSSSAAAGRSSRPAERRFFAEAAPWGFILFARNVADPAQLRRLTGDAARQRRARRAGPDRPGGRAGGAAARRRPGASGRRRSTSASGCRRALRARAMRLRYRLIAGELRARRDRRELRAGARPGAGRDARGHPQPLLRRAIPAEVAAIGRAVAEGLHGRRRAAGDEAHAGPGAGGARQPPRPAGGDGGPGGARRRISRRSGRSPTCRWR